MAFPLTVTADSRYSLTSTFLHSAAIFARRAHDTEITVSSQTLTGDVLDEHKGYVLAAVMQAVASLEAELYEVIVHGPGHHRGSNHIDIVERDLLRSALIRGGRPKLPKDSHLPKYGSETLYFYSLVVSLLKRKPLTAVGQGSAAALLVRLRNELTHYKSQWSADIDADFIASLDALQLRRPAFVDTTENRFPRRYLSAACAAWAVETAMGVLLDFYVVLGHPPPIAHVVDKVQALLVACRSAAA